MLSSKQLRSLGWPTVIAPSLAPQFSGTSYITDTTLTSNQAIFPSYLSKEYGPGPQGIYIEKAFLLFGIRSLSLLNFHASVITHPPIIRCWPAGRGSWPTGQPVGQWVGLGK